MFSEIGKSHSRYNLQENEKRKKLEAERAQNEIKEQERRAKEELEEKRKSWQKKIDDLETEIKLTAAKKASASQGLMDKLNQIKSCKTPMQTQVCKVIEVIWLCKYLF